MSARSEADERRLTNSIVKLTQVIGALKSCKSIKCVHDESMKLLSLAYDNRDLWNYKDDNQNDIVIMSLRKSINMAIDGLEHNQHLRFDFSDPVKANLSQMVQINIEQISSLLKVDREVEIEMDVKDDAEKALRIHNELNRANDSLDSLSNQFEKEVEELKDIEELLLAVERDEERLRQREQELEELLMRLREDREMKSSERARLLKAADDKGIELSRIELRKNKLQEKIDFQLNTLNEIETRHSTSFSRPHSFDRYQDFDFDSEDYY